MTSVQNVMEWLNVSRQTHPALDEDADALLTRLLGLDAQQQTHQQACQRRASIALFGHSQASKAHLLRTLCGSGDGRLAVQTGSKTLDYFSHINPGHSLTQMAVRFSRDPATPDDAFPLRLMLMSEAELVQLFITHALQRGDVRAPDGNVIAQRLRGWQSLRQPQPVPGITPPEVAAIARFWRDTLPTSYQQIDDELWYQFARLLPSLDLTARARAWSLLWGEQQEFTQQWLKLAHTLHQLGNRREVMAPLSLLVDAFTLPMDAFLTPCSESEDAVLVHPLAAEGYQNAVSIPATTLALLTVELVLSCENGVLDNVDIIDIPVPEATAESPLWACKCRWLLDHYRQHRQPDILLVCNATAQRTMIPATAKALLRWVNETQPAQENKLPGLVWAITPEDDRFVHQRHFDEAIQQLVGKPGQHWGTLQALDHSSLQRLVEWLSQATLPELRQRRFAAIAIGYQQQLNALCQPLLSSTQNHAAQAQAAIRELQTHASRHGELLESLLPELAAFDALCQVQQQREEKVSGLFNDAVDLFAAPEAPQQSAFTHQDHGSQAYALWCKHLRQWSRQPHAVLTPATQQQLTLTLIAASQQMSLAQRLRRVSAEQQAGAAQLRATIGDFINWLGYVEMPIDQRPASRVAKDSAIFAQNTATSSARLTQLGEQPVHAATRYVYDWLVALYARSTAAGEEINLLQLDKAAQRQLQSLLQ